MIFPKCEEAAPLESRDVLRLGTRREILCLWNGRDSSTLYLGVSSAHDAVMALCRFRTWASDSSLIPPEAECRSVARAVDGRRPFGPRRPAGSFFETRARHSRAGVKIINSRMLRIPASPQNQCAFLLRIKRQRLPPAHVEHFSI